jgi:hypothetical protein
MLRALLEGDFCKWCGRPLSRSVIAQLAAVERTDTVLYPVLCVCGGITVIGAGTFVSHFDELQE